jgi:D-alanyl-D-alanine dipeptidase
MCWLISLVLFASSAVAGPLPAGFVRLKEVAPEVRQEMRYAGPENFTGRAVPGYGAGECWLRKETAAALGAAASDLATAGWRLVVYDCYRPVRAVSAFARWAEDVADQSRKTDYYPEIDKRKLFTLGYIARTSSHSNGTAVDLGAEALDGRPIDFGTPFDFFSPRSGAGGAVGPEAQKNRKVLAEAMARHGLVNYAREWWHFSRSAPGARAEDVPITP